MSIHRTAVTDTRAPRRRPNTSRIKTVRVNSLVWHEARRLAQGNARRLTIIDAETVIVRNR
jgi:hypothetical protein